MTEAFNYDSSQAKIMPGADWPQIVESARKDVRNSVYGSQIFAIHRLGVALAGAECVLGDVEVSLDDFANSAIPPMTSEERDELASGLIGGGYMLLKGASHV